MWSWTTVRLGGSEGGDDDKDQDDRGTAGILRFSSGMRSLGERKTGNRCQKVVASE